MAAHRLGVGVVLLSVWALAGEARAADIASILGTPGDATFGLECPSGSVPGGLDDGIPECPIGVLGVTEADCLHRVDIDTSAGAYPQAICSDGTAPSFYVRPFTDPADAGRWVIHLQGGGGCIDEETCRARWCGDDGLNTAAIMSNDWDANGIVDRPEQAWVLGISSNVPTNPFATWNHVYIPYCTSDLWLGRDSNVDLGAFTVAARGHTLLYAVRNMLRDLGPAWSPLGTGVYDMPLLDDADEILFTGTSAGGYGALQNADWFLDKFPDARVGLVVDAAIDIDPWTLADFDVWETTTGWPYASARYQVFIDRWAPGGYWNAIDAFIDETCRGVYEFGAGLEYCMSPSQLLILSAGGFPHIQTPIFTRMDLEDNVLSKWIVGPWTVDDPQPDGHEPTMGNGGPLATLQDYTEMQRETMVLLDSDAQTDISVFAPRCAHHVGLEDGSAFANWTTDNTSDSIPRVADGTPSTFRDALWSWFNPGGDFVRDRWIDTDEVDALGNAIDYSSCP